MTETGRDAQDQEPLLSAVLAAPLGLAAARLTIHNLARQSIASRIELVLVVDDAPTADALTAADAAFHSCRIVRAGSFTTAATANAAGVRAARSPLVALCEDHCFPERGWGRALIDAMADPTLAAVGPAFTNANPATAVSRADFLMGYGPWMAPARGGDVDALPGHNSCYRRDVLLHEGSELESALEAEYVFHGRLRAAGQRLALVPEARVAHTNFATLQPWLRISRDVARSFAVRRAEHWPPSRRLAYCAAGPLIPLVRLARAIRHARSRQQRLDAGTLVALAVGLAADAWGQVLGYATRRTATPDRAWDFGRDRFVPPADRDALQRRFVESPEAGSEA